MFIEIIWVSLIDVQTIIFNTWTNARHFTHISAICNSLFNQITFTGVVINHEQWLANFAW